MKQPLIPANQSLPEFNLKVICLSLILAVILATSNTYLALKIGILTSASIPAAVISMGILRFIKHSTILQNNLVQTAASAGEAVAGGIVYTVPALIILHYWQHFNYLENLAIALTGGILGVFFSIPLRRVLMTEPNLSYPEGKAIAQLLISGEKKSVGFSEMLLGGAVGSGLEFIQNGLQIISANFQKWFVVGNTYMGFGTGFSAALVGAGYLIGIRTGISILAGAILGWLIGIPALGAYTGITLSKNNATDVVMHFWSTEVRYLGIGAMLTAGIITLLYLSKPFLESMKASLKTVRQHGNSEEKLPRTEQDIPLPLIIIGIVLVLIAIYGLLNHLFHYQNLGLSFSNAGFLLGCSLYIVIIGFIAATICGYFSGLVGVSASPGSSIVIASLLLAALIIRALLTEPLTPAQMKEAAAITIMLGAIITGAAAIANDNIQDLKVGHLIGSTPWKQQLMLLLGVVAAAVVIPPIMEVLFSVYGIADVLPHAGMDPAKTLAAPPAAMMATVTQAVFNHQMPITMLLLGSLFVLPLWAINFFLNKKGIGLSILAVAIGIYLPLTSSIPLSIGACFAWLNRRQLGKKIENAQQRVEQEQKGTLLACGLVSGAALMDVVLAIPFALSHNPDILKIMPAQAAWVADLLGFVSLYVLGFWLYKRVLSK